MQLLYNGQTYNFQPATLTFNRSLGSQLQLLYYRGATYTYQMSEPQPLLPPRVVNWRYEVQ